MTQKLLSIDDLSILLPTGADRQYAVQDIGLELHAGETVGVVGPSGCGKSTLCRALMGLNAVRGGEVLLQGRDLRRLLKLNQ